MRPVGPDGPGASFIPLFISDDAGTATGHLALGNRQWEHAGGPVPALVTWVGPEAYDSPNYHPPTQEHGNAVPSWNFTAVRGPGDLVLPSWSAGRWRRWPPPGRAALTPAGW